MDSWNQKEELSRRGFLKRVAAVGTALAVAPAWETAQAVTGATADNEAVHTAGAKAAAITAHRTLGTGKAAFKVSAMGFGVMWMTYNRSYHPDKKQHPSASRGNGEGSDTV